MTTEHIYQSTLITLYLAIAENSGFDHKGLWSDAKLFTH